MDIDKNVRKRLEEKLGRRIPPPTEEKFFRPFMTELWANDPDSAAEIEDNIILDLGDPQNDAQRADERAMRRQMVWRRLFYQYDEITNRWHLHREKLLGYFGIALMLWLVPVMVSRSQRGGGEVPLQNTATATVQTVAASPSPPEFKPDDEPIEIEKPPAVAAPVVQTPLQESNPVIPTSSGDSSDTVVSLRSYSKDDLEPAAERPPLGGYHRGGDAAGGGGGDPFAEGGGGRSSGLSAYAKDAPTGDAPSGLSAYAKGQDERTMRSPGGGSGGAGGASSAPTEPNDFESDDPLGTGAAPTPAARQVVANANETVQNDADPFFTPSPGSESYRVGDTVAAELVVGLIALGSDPLPVVATGRDGSVWQGEAILNEGGRIDIRFSSVYRNGGNQALDAVALAEDGYAGVPAAIKETTPALASDLVRGGLRGVSEFVEGLQEENSVTLQDGTVVVDQSSAPLDASVLGSVARLFEPPGGEDQQALVRVGELANGSKFEVVVLADTPENDSGSGDETDSNSQ